MICILKEQQAVYVNSFTVRVGLIKILLFDLCWTTLDYIFFYSSDCYTTVTLWLLCPHECHLNFWRGALEGTMTSLLAHTSCTAVRSNVDFRVEHIPLNAPLSPSECVKLWHRQTSREREAQINLQSRETISRVFFITWLSVQTVSVAESLTRFTRQTEIMPTFGTQRTLFQTHSHNCIYNIYRKCVLKKWDILCVWDFRAGSKLSSVMCMSSANVDPAFDFDCWK